MVNDGHAFKLFFTEGKENMNTQDLSGRPKTSRRTNKAIAELRHRYAFGETINSATRTPEGKSKYGSGLISKFASGDGSSNSYAYDSRQLASAYTPKQLEEAIDVCKRYDAAMGPSHHIELMRVRDCELRDQLGSNAAREKWSVKRLKKEIKKAVAK